MNVIHIQSASHRVGSARPLLLLAALTVFGAGLAVGMNWQARRSAAQGAEEAPAEQSQLWTCGMHPQVIQDHPGSCPICGMDLVPVEDSAGSGPAAGAVLEIDPIVVQNMGLRLATVTAGPLTRTIRAVGVLAEPEPARHDVNLRLSGWIDRLHAGTEGMRLAQGDPLFDLYSPELQVAVEELIGARKMSEGPAARAQAEAILRSARRKLELYGLESAQISELAALDEAPRTVTFVSPADGYLTAKSVYAGSAVTAGDMVMRISDTSTMWLDARVFEKDLAQVRVGQEVTARMDGRPGEVFSGQVILVHPRIDAATRTALVRMEIGNPGFLLRDGMFATASLKAEIIERAVTVPREAVIDTGSRQIAFVALDLGHFEPRQISMGASGDDGMVEVLSGLVPGEQVVVSGQFLLDAESRMKEAIRRFLDQKSHPAPPQMASVTAEWRGAVEEALAAYLEMSNAFGVPAASADPIDAAHLIRAAGELRARASGAEQSGLGDRLAAAAAALQGMDLDRQRESFAAVSEAAIDLALRSPRTGESVPMLFIAYCPMKQARWMQATETIMNPYYAREMKDCGDVVSSVPVSGQEDDPK